MKVLPPTTYSPLYILLKGKLNIIAKEANGDEFVVHQMKCGDAFGYSDLLKAVVST